MVAVALALLVGDPSAGLLRAQEDVNVQADRGPRFMLASTVGSTPVLANPARVALLRMRVSADLRDTTIEGALDVISAQTGIQFVYSADVVPLRSRTSLRANGISVAAALTEVLLDADVDVIVSGNQAALVRRIRSVVRQVGAIAGRVTDASTQQGVDGVRVFLEGTRSSTTTGSTGSYRLAAVPAGAYILVTRRLGYKASEQAVTVEDGREVTVDVALEPVPSALDEVVMTVTGEQRLRELGHVVGRINADSLVKEAPVSSLSELLNGRVPGLQVFTESGQVGGDVSLQVRTPSSISLGTEPIVIVDGIRYTSGRAGSGGTFNVEGTNRLNDLNPNDLASIEVVKGPSAATLYGTDAANGVIVITTKRGRPGPAQWNFYGKGSTTAAPRVRYPDIYWGSPGFSGGFSSCSLRLVALGRCTQDSITVLPHPLNDPQFSILASKPRWEYGANVMGGRQEFRYYFSGEFERAIGPIQMPPAVVEQLIKQRGGTALPDEQLEPNALTKTNLRANVTVSLGQNGQVDLQTGYARNATRTIAYGGPHWALSTPTMPYGDDSGLDPGEVFASMSTEQVDRFFGSATGQWRPLPWLQTRGTVGLDLGNGNRYSLARPGEAPNSYPNGFVGDDRTRQFSTSADLGLTALVKRGRLSFRTAMGAQYVRSLTNDLSSTGSDLPPGGESIGQTVSQRVSQSYSEAVTLGSYAEETLGLNDRFFLTGALRLDGASAFGHDYEAALYPKAGVSWIVSEEPFLPRIPGLDELRLRYAFGASGQQPLPTMVLSAFSVQTIALDGNVTNRIALQSLGNPNLRPERTREHEIGLDASGLTDRLRLGLTWFRRTSIDQIVPTQVSAFFGVMNANLGRVTGRGFEAELGAQLIETRLLSWQVSLQHSMRRSLLEELGELSPFYSEEGGFVEGYSLGARFGKPLVGYADANGDGILAPSEVQVGTEPVYLGESTPPRTQTLTTAIGLFQQRLRLSALVERRSGFTQRNVQLWNQCVSGRCRAAVDPNTPLEEQAKVAARTPATFMESGTFTRLREVTAVVDLPARPLRAVRLRSGTFSVAARNLALWTEFSGADPESAQVFRFLGGSAGGIPQSGSWVFRLDLGL